MKIDFINQELKDYLQILNQVIPSRTTRPVLSCLYIEAVNNQVYLTATDLEVGVYCRLSEAQVKEEGKCVISASRLSAICHEILSEGLTLEVKKNRIHLESQGSDFKLPLEDPDDYPDLEFKAESCGSIETESLVSMIRKTSFATAAERSRFAINGIHVQIKNKNLSMTATDGRRLANMCQKVKGKISEFTAIVPARALILLQKVVSQLGETKIEVERDDNQIIFHTDSVSILARLISGKFPDYQSVIPNKNDNILTITRGDFERIIRSAALVTSDDSRSILLDLSPGKLSASAKTQIFGESKIEEDVQYEGEELAIRFNPTYLLEGLRVCDSKEIDFSLKDNHSAGLLKEKNGSTYQYVVTPINLVS